MTQFLTTFAADKCSRFLGFPTWYEYIHDPNNCSVIKIDSINDVWLIVAALIEIFLRVAALVAVGFVMYGSFKYITSQAEPDAVTKARQTIVNALIGLVIAILAAGVVNFIAGNIN